MTAPTLEGTEIHPDAPEFKDYAYKVTARPAHAPEFTFYVDGPFYLSSRAQTWYVRATPDGSGWFSKHRSLAIAARSANYRARRYIRAYSKPRNVITRQSVPV